jgi:hypothetical protein
MEVLIIIYDFATKENYKKAIMKRIPDFDAIPVRIPLSCLFK